MKLIGKSGDRVRLENESNDTCEFEKEAVRNYRMSRTRIDLARLTQNLDRERADSISIAGQEGARAVITRGERRFFRRVDGDILTDNEAQMILTVTGIRTNGSPDGWTFSEGDDGAEFRARVEDEEFLEAVRRGQYHFREGTAILAVMRTLQLRRGRTSTHRSIIEVLDVIDP